MEKETVKSMKLDDLNAVKEFLSQVQGNDIHEVIFTQEEVDEHETIK